MAINTFHPFCRLSIEPQKAIQESAVRPVNRTLVHCFTLFNEIDKEYSDVMATKSMKTVIDSPARSAVIARCPAEATGTAALVIERTTSTCEAAFASTACAVIGGDVSREASTRGPGLTILEMSVRPSSDFDITGESSKHTSPGRSGFQCFRNIQCWSSTSQTRPRRTSCRSSNHRRRPWRDCRPRRCTFQKTPGSPCRNGLKTFRRNRSPNSSLQMSIPYTSCRSCRSFHP